MNPDRWKQVEHIFNEVIGVSTENRQTALDEFCKDDDELRIEVQKMLKADAGYDPFIDIPAIGERSPEESETLSNPDPLLGRNIGPYRILRRIGEGGMGVVYHGKRDDDVAGYEVAIKLVQRGMNSEDVLKRFKSERQVLANLNHPNIARLLDGGTAEDGRPYLIMEYVQGRRIDEYCDDLNLDIIKRIQLFRQVCHAVHFAHQNLIVHRDLKPGNILITDEGVPKLLDFGISKVLGTPVSEQTATEARILTPEFASPEQILGEPVTTASDVYSLGVILYSILTGERPYELSSQNISQIEKTISEQNPIRPSTRIYHNTNSNDDDTAKKSENVAKQRQTTPDRLKKILRGDLDNIVLMALRKEPERRYASAEQFAEDLQRYLTGLPVLARVDTFQYRTIKFVNRNRAAVLLAFLVITALTGGIITTAWQASIAAKERDALRLAQKDLLLEAEHTSIEADSASQISEFLINTVLRTIPGHSEEELEGIINQLDLETDRIYRQFDDEKHLQANLLDALGKTYQNLGMHDKAEKLLTSAIEMRKNEFGEDSIEVALSLNSLGELHYSTGDFSKAELEFRKSLELHRTLPEQVHTDVATAANNLAVVLHHKGDNEHAEKLHREALNIRLEKYGIHSAQVAESFNNLSSLLLAKAQYQEAIEYLKQVVEIRVDLLGDNHPDVAQAQNNLAVTYHTIGDYEEAAKWYLASIKIHRILGSVGQEGLARTLTNYADILVNNDKVEEAHVVMLESLQILKEKYGNEHHLVASCQTRLAVILEKLEKYEDAEEYFRQSLQTRRNIFPEGNQKICLSLLEFGSFLLNTDRPEDAETLFREALEICNTYLADYQGKTLFANASYSLGISLYKLKQFEEAETLLLKSLDTYTSINNPNQRTESEKKNVLNYLFKLYTDWDRPEEAEKYNINQDNT